VDAEGLAHRRDRPGQHHAALSGLGEIDVQLVIVSERLDLADVLVRGAMGAGELRARQRSDLLPVQTSGELTPERRRRTSVTVIFSLGSIGPTKRAPGSGTRSLPETECRILVFSDMDHSFKSMGENLPEAECRSVKASLYGYRSLFLCKTIRQSSGAPYPNFCRYAISPFTPPVSAQPCSSGPDASEAQMAAAARPMID
jgi:hypothetical protein